MRLSVRIGMEAQAATCYFHEVGTDAVGAT